MKSMLKWYAAVAMAAAAHLGTAPLVYGQSQIVGAQPQSSDNNQPGASAESSNDAASGAVDLPVLYVTDVEVLQTASEPKVNVVSVTGVVSSDGWTFPQLVPTYAGKPFDGVVDLEFIATAPVQSQLATGFVPVSAVFPLEPDPGLKGVRVRGADNAISVLKVPGSNRSTVQANDCRDCLGKRFAPSGQAQAGEPGVVRQEDLPKTLRVIGPSDGIRGTHQDPDRLTLITDEKGTIVEAFWE